MTENFLFLFQYLKKENIAIDKEEFVLQFQSHTSYPSLLAISDTLSFFNIENLATQLHFEDIIHLPNNFIALLKNENSQQFLTLVEKDGANFTYQENKKRFVFLKVILKVFSKISFYWPKKKKIMKLKQNQSLTHHF